MRIRSIVASGLAAFACGGSGEPAPETVTRDLEPGETASTGDGVTAADPVNTSVTVPEGGEVTVEETSIDEDAPDGVTFIGQQVNITAPDGTAREPLVLEFILHSSLVPSGETEETIHLFRSGRLVAPSCTGPDGEAAPDPCVAERSIDDGNITLTALTSEASPWNFGTVEGSITELPKAYEEGDEDKGELNIDLLQEATWPVQIDGDLASVNVPFSTPLPSAVEDLEDPGEELASAISMAVRSDESGATVNFTNGTFVGDEPDEPGEFTLTLNAARTQATLTFFNESPNGLTLRTDRTYTVSIAIDGSDYIEDLVSSTFEVAPE